MKKTTKTFAVIIALAGLVGFSALVVHNYKTKTSFKYSKESPKEVTQNPQDAVSAAVNEEAAANKIKRDDALLQISNSDMIYGDRKAPVIIIEYASLSCPHCANFYREGFEKLKTEYIDSGKVQFIYRDFPLNQPALAASMLSFCYNEDNKENKSDDYYGFIKVLFKTQDSWAFDPKYSEKLASIAKLDGMSEDRFKSCMGDQKLQSKILQSRMEAAKSLQLQSTPTFFINGEISEGYIDYPSLKKIIEKKLDEKNK
jgi:protein-disulfide isomerase